MKYKRDRLCSRELLEKNIVIKGLSHPYSWAIEVLRKAKVRGNAKKHKDIFDKRELEKDRIKALKI